MTDTQNPRSAPSALEELYREKLMDAAMAVDPKERARLRLVAGIFKPQPLSRVLIP